MELTGNKKPHYAWAVLVGAALLMFCGYGICYNIMSVFVAALETELSMTKTETSSIMSVIMITSAVVNLIVAILYKKYSIRKISIIFVGFMVLGFLAMSMARGPIGCDLAAALVGVGYGGGALIPASLLVGNWFVEKKGLALGISSASSGIATIVLPIVVGKMIEAVGIYATLRCVAAFIFLLGIVIFTIVRSKPEDKGLLPYGITDRSQLPQESKPESSAGKAGLKQVLTSRGFITVALTMIFTSACMGPAVAMFASLMTSAGYSLEFETFVLTCYGFAIVVGKIFMGVLIDKIGSVKTNIYGYAVTLLMVLSGFALNMSPAVPFIFAILMGFACPLCSVMVPIWAADFLDKEIYAQAFSYACFCGCVGTAVALPIAGKLVDITGSFKIAYVVMLVGALVAAITILSSYARKKKAN